MKFNDRFYPTPLPKLLKIILNNLKNGHVLGLPQQLFFRPQENDFFKTRFFGKPIDSPIGVAAGPHTQLSQNIVLAWLAGARFIELKTVQTLDELDISKPCIDMQDEGYNCEWSQELKIYQAFEQYLDAWILVHILAKELGLEHHGAIFNMSVGYNMEGILKDNVQWFLDNMTDASKYLEQKIELIKPIYPQITEIQIPAQISDNITLSTMHGCPPDEVEQIANYLLSKRKLHTIIKLNPTLLGPEMIRKILKNGGYKTIVPDIAFEHDLKFDQAVEIIKRLLKVAEQHNRFFGIKLTNTLESLNHKGYFDDQEMYMSGKALHPISINLARKFQNHFNGSLNISFSGGADAFNVVNILRSGLRPVTVSSDLLKPGGYGRLAQYYENLRNEQQNLNIHSINDLILHGHQTQDVQKAALKNLNDYADLVLISPYYQKQGFTDPSIKTSRPLGEFDCIAAPCQQTCPTNQDVPQYMYFVSTGQLDKAFTTVLEDNPFPTVLGYTCDHTCQLKCTRINYDESLQIREIKRFIAENNKDRPFTLPVRKVKNTGHVAIVGGGPGGLSAAFFLRLYGFDVDIYEASDSPGGMVARAIPKFRITDQAIEQDIKRILDLGVKVFYNQRLTYDQIEELRGKYTAVIVAAGASKSLTLEIPGYDAQGVWDPLEFFFVTRKNPSLDIGKTVAVIGGGNTAMDAARIAKRLVGNDGKVYLLYRRTKEYMPADYHEILDTLKEGVELIELVQPVRYIVEDNHVTGIELQKVKLQDTGKGRPKPVPIEGETFILPVDAVIPAVGQIIDEQTVPPNLVLKDKIPHSRQPGIYVIGDAARGGFSIVGAVNDGKIAAYDIIRKLNPDFSPYHYRENKDLSYWELKLKRYKRIPPEEVTEVPVDQRKNFELIIETMDEQTARQEASRCLLCDELCDICTTVCPNMANQHYQIKPAKYELQKIVIQNGQVQTLDDKIFEIKQQYQTLNIGDWCNECGNCATFCPTAGRPYVDKPKLHLSWQSFMDSPFGYYVFFDKNTPTVYYKDQNVTAKLQVLQSGFVYETNQTTVQLDRNFRIKSVKSQLQMAELTLDLAVRMFMVYQAYLQIFE